MIIFEILYITDWIPPGRPMASIFLRIILSMVVIFFTSIFSRPFLVARNIRVANAATAWLMTVASAAPLTPRLRTAINMTSRTMFDNAPRIRNPRGCFESPNALNTPEAMLKTTSPIDPIKYIWRYVDARGKISSGVAISLNIGFVRR